MPEDENSRLFRREIAPHLPDAYNLARWLTGNGADAEDAVQDACLRAYRFASRVQEGKGRAWLYRIVRNCCFTSLRRRPNHRDLTEVSEVPDPAPDAESQLTLESTAQELRTALEQLAPEWREVLILRDWEDLSYREIAEITDVPEGTVMSRLSRARRQLRRALEEKEGARNAAL